MNWKTVQISVKKNGSFANPPLGFETKKPALLELGQE